MAASPAQSAIAPRCYETCGSAVPRRLPRGPQAAPGVALAGREQRPAERVVRRTTDGRSASAVRASATTASRSAPRCAWLALEERELEVVVAAGRGEEAPPRADEGVGVVRAGGVAARRADVAEGDHDLGQRQVVGRRSYHCSAARGRRGRRRPRRGRPRRARSSGSSASAWRYSALGLVDAARLAAGRRAGCASTACSRGCPSRPARPGA